MGGWNAFVQSVPNRTLCYDDSIARVGFMMTQDAKSFVDSLISNGLVFVQNAKAIDVVVVDQLHGPACGCDWIECGYLEHFASKIKIKYCRFAGSKSLQCSLPEGWEYEKSISRKFSYIAEEDMASRLSFVRHEEGKDVFLDRVTGKEVYIGRTSS
jgi:hypothetical protein